MRRFTRLGLMCFWVILALVLTNRPAPRVLPDPAALTTVPLGALPKTRPRGAVVVLTDAAGVLDMPDPRWFLLVTVRDVAGDPVAAQVALVDRHTGTVTTYAPRPTHLLNLPASNRDLVLRVSAPGYAAVEQAFRVDLRADADYVWHVVLELVMERSE